MDSADPRKSINPGHEGHGVHLCSRCGWAFPNAHPSARHRRAHKRVCGTIEGYTLVFDSGSGTLSSQHSAVSSFSDDEHASDGDSKAPSAKGVISRSVSVGGSRRVLERKNTSADDVFTDAVSEFADANAGLGGNEGLDASEETLSHKGFGVPSFTPVEDVAVTGGTVQASINHENSKKSSQEGTTTSPNQKPVTCFSEIPANVDDAVTHTSEENRKSNAIEDPDVLETGFTKIDDVSEVNMAPVFVPVSKDACESSETVTEERTSKYDLTEAESEISQNKEKHNINSGSETLMDDHVQDDENLLCSSDEVSGVKVDDIPHDKFDEGSASTSPVITEVVVVPSITESDNVVLVNKQVDESSCEIEGNTSSSLSVEGIGALPHATEIEALETSLAHTGTGHGSDDSNEKNLNSLKRASANDDTTSHENGQVGSIGGNNTIDLEDGYDKKGIVPEDFATKAEGNVSENETKSDNLSLYIRAEEPVSMSPAVLVQSVGTTSEAALDQLDGLVESLHTVKSVQFSSDVKSSLDGELSETTEFSKEMKSDDAEASDLVNGTKPASHDVLLQKLEEDLSDDEPIKSFPATESSGQSLGNNQVNDGGFFCKDSSAKDIWQSQAGNAEPEKGSAISAVDAPCEISSPNGSSLDGNWGSVSVLSATSDAACDVKKMKEARDGQSHDKYDTFDPPSFLTLIEPQAQKAAAASSTSGELQNPPHPEAVWFPSITDAPHDSDGRKKNEEIIAKVTNWGTGKQHSPLKTLLGEAKASSLNSNPSAAMPKDKIPVKKNGAPVPMVNSIPDHPKDKLDSSAKEWSPRGGYPDEIKGEKRKVKGKPYWVPFMCCSSGN